MTARKKQFEARAAGTWRSPQIRSYRKVIDYLGHNGWIPEDAYQLASTYPRRLTAQDGPCGWILDVVHESLERHLDGREKELQDPDDLRINLYCRREEDREPDYERNGSKVNGTLHYAVIGLGIDSIGSIRTKFGDKVTGYIEDKIRDVIDRTLRSDDMVMERQGHEYLILAKDVRPDGAHKIADRLRHTIRGQVNTYVALQLYRDPVNGNIARADALMDVPVTASFGAVMPSGSDEPYETIKLACARLTKAQSIGDCIIGG